MNFNELSDFLIELNLAIVTLALLTKLPQSSDLGIPSSTGPFRGWHHA